MSPRYDLTLVAPDRSVYAGRVQSLVAPGAEGSFGVLANHAPMVAQLAVGELKVVDEPGETHYFALTGGFLEVTWEGVIITADAAEEAKDINATRARAAETRARERLASQNLDADHMRAAASLSRALNRLRVVAHVPYSAPQPPAARPEEERNQPGEQS